MTNPSLSSALSCPREGKRARRSSGNKHNNDSNEQSPRRSSQPSSTTGGANHEGGGNERICFIGDSFIRKFGLIKHRSIKVQGYKGASAKGLARTGNENREHIIKMLFGANAGEDQDPGPCSYDRVVFNFGNVDVHLSYYYKLYGSAKAKIDLVEIAQNYVDFVTSLFPARQDNNVGEDEKSNKETAPTPTSPKVIILGVYPSAPEDQHVAASLVSYGSLTQEEADTIPSEDTLRNVRRARVDAFNTAMKEKILAFDNPNVEYADANDEITDPTTGGIREAYRDVSDHNIHIVWETTVILWMKRWPWYGCLAPAGFEEDLRRTLSKYLKTKPWAERKHVTAEMGGDVRAAVNNNNRNSNRHRSYDHNRNRNSHENNRNWGRRRDYRNHWDEGRDNGYSNDRSHHNNRDNNYRRYDSNRDDHHRGSWDNNSPQYGGTGNERRNHNWNNSNNRSNSRGR